MPELFSPELTAEWEFKLAQMEHGKLKRDAFMREIVAMTQHIVGQAKGYESDTIPGDFGTLSARCPKCGGEVHENYKKFQCQSCAFGFWKIMGGRQLDVTEADTLLRERQVGPLEGFRSRLGRPFTASIKLNDANEVSFDFGDGSADDSGEAPDFTGLEPLGPCPKCKSRVFETAAGLRLREGGRAREDLRFPLRPRDPAAAGRARRRCRSSSPPARPTCCSSSRRARSAAFRRSSCGSPTARSASSSKRRTRRRAERGAGAAPAALRVLGPHPRDKKPVELHAGRYGPYVKHGDVNATLPDRDKVDSLTLDEALALLAEKDAKQGAPGARTAARKGPAATKPRAPVAAPETARRGTTAKRTPAAGAKPSAKRSPRGRRPRTP